MQSAQHGAWLWWQGRRGGWSGRSIWCCLLGAWMLLVITQVVLLERPSLVHPALARKCYSVNAAARLQLVNTCCLMHNYTSQDVATCVERHRAAVLRPESGKHPRSAATPNTSIHSPNEYLFNFYRAAPRASFNSSSSPGVPIPLGSTGPPANLTWAMVGDSRVRQVFSALVTRLSSPRLRYKKPSTMGKWRNIHELTESLRIGKLHEDIEVHHMDTSMRLVFYWDPLLTRLPQLLSQWGNNVEHHPALLLIGSALHWMKTTISTSSSKTHTSPALAFDRFRQHMLSLLPLLEQQAEITQIIFHLQDHVLESQIFKKYQNIYSNNNVDQYNAFLSTLVTGTNIILWDSNIPFSDMYYAQCRHNYRKTYDMSWNCDDPLHSGYVIVEKYADMLLNDVCNPFLNLDARYC